MNDHGDQPQANPKVVEVMESLAAFGIDNDTLGVIMEPIIVKVMDAQIPRLMADLPRTVEAVLTAKMDQLSGSLETQVDQRVKALLAAVTAGSTGSNGAAPSAASAGAAPAAAAAGTDVASAVLGMIMKKIMGPAAGAADGSQQLAGVIAYSKSMGAIFNEVMAPVMELYNRGANDERSRLTTLSKMGIETPLGHEAPPVPMPIQATIDNRPVAAELHQDAADVAARIKLS